MTTRNKGARTKGVKGCTGVPLYTGGSRGGLTREATQFLAQLPTTLEELRTAYEHEVEALAGDLREQLEAGWLSGYRDSEDGFDALRRVCRLRFGLERIGFAQTHLLLATSLYGEMLDDTWRDRRDHVASAIAYDVLRVAVARGWYTPEPDEEPSAEDLRRGARAAIVDAPAPRRRGRRA